MNTINEMRWNISITVVIVLAMLSFFSCCLYKAETRIQRMTAEEKRIERNVHRRDSAEAVAQQDTAKWNEFIRATHMPGEGGDASCDSIFTAIYGYSIEDL